MTTIGNDEKATPTTRRISTDLVIGLSLLGVVIAGHLLWALSDGSILTAIGIR